MLAAAVSDVSLELMTVPLRTRDVEGLRKAVEWLLEDLES